jgi:hypothetical protein
MPARRRETRGFAVASWLLSSVAAGQLVAVMFAGPASGQAYHREAGQEHYGRRCSHQDTQVAGGTIVGVGGQVIAGGGGTGVGCDTFYAYEVRAGEPKAVVPWTEPGIYLNPGKR